MGDQKDNHKDDPLEGMLDFAGKWLCPETIPYPGLTEESHEIPQLVTDSRKTIAIWVYKQRVPCVWVVFLGGTGTGKSTLFNAVCGKVLSETGVERPKTSGPIAYAHRDCSLESAFPFPGTTVTRIPSTDSSFTPAAGLTGTLLALVHDRDNWSHLVLVDTPDLDSVEMRNRKIAEDLYSLSDAVVFLTSQEKYADEVPSLFLKRIMRERKSCYVIFNKADTAATKEEVLSTFQGENASIPGDRIWLVPYSTTPAFQSVLDSPAFHGFSRLFSKEVCGSEGSKLLRATQAKQKEAAEKSLARLLVLLEREKTDAIRWLNQLRTLSQGASRDLIHEQRDRFSRRSGDYLSSEIRRLFAKYDVLARPRQIVKHILLAPLRFLGLMDAETPDAHRNALQKVREKIDLVPIQTAVERFNRLVLERLSPPDQTAPLFTLIRKPSLALSGEEVRSLIWEEQDKLDKWLEKTFDGLAQAIPSHKKWGIYTTSVLWGILIIAFEVAVGGGFSILDAAMDSAIAPFVTKGAVELFAYHEIRKIARQLAERYQEGLVSVITKQEERYEQCLNSLLISQQTLTMLKEFHSRIRDFKSPGSP
jgi:GTPase SAR1 family protein